MKDTIAKEKSDIAPRANKRGRSRTTEKKVIPEKKIKLGSVSSKQLLDEMKAFEELLQKAIHFQLYLRLQKLFMMIMILI